MPRTGCGGAMGEWKSECLAQGAVERWGNGKANASHRARWSGEGMEKRMHRTGRGGAVREWKSECIAQGAVERDGAAQEARLEGARGSVVSANALLQ